MPSANQHAQYTQRLQRFIENHLPLVKAMGAEITDYSDKAFSLSAPLALNHNDKMTGFGGSLYCLCVTNAIGLMFIKCFEQGLNPDLVVSHAEIDYQRPVADALITATASSPDTADWQQFFTRFDERGKAGMSLSSHIYSAGQLAVSFNGRFAIVGETDSSC
ncbi:MAG: YiiD C-terminal domain-containing protein [Pseudomonadales bacterium]|nr:YiiD C-terminal domain-containing protein [Pseudomonadales bacterium]